jgi:very-short-patch-repair endonuclease
MCPKCYAAAGERCKGPRGGYRSAVHRERCSFAERPNPLLAPRPAAEKNGRLEESIASALGEIETLFRAQIAHFSKRCESPIEELLAASIVLHGRSDFDREKRISHFDTTDVYIQAQVGAYRVDFLFDDLFQGKRRFLIVELDGHEWHERTKAQAARDKKRDRTLVTAGYRVLRFTGSEIYANPGACNQEIVEAILAGRDCE